MNQIYDVADTISFTYKGRRKVKGEVIRIDKIGISVLLHTDYYGKNEVWYDGEIKYFNKKEMKNINKIYYGCRKLE